MIPPEGKQCISDGHSDKKSADALSRNGEGFLFGVLNTQEGDNTC